MTGPLPGAQITARLHVEAGAVVFEGARRRRHRDFHVLELHGGPYDRARQHGALLRDRIPHGPLPLFRRYLEVLVRGSPLRRLSGPLVALLERSVQERLVRRLPDEMRAVVAGIADGAGLPEVDVLRAYVMPEAMVYLLGTYGRLTGAPVAPGCPSAPAFGCTSAVVAGHRTARGHLLHGRNLDFAGVGRWDAEATVAFHRPLEGHAYAGITAAGIWGAGITGMNEAGVVCVVHQHFPRTVDFGGEPVGVVGERVLQEAGDVDEAIAVLDRHRPVGAWTYVVSDPERAVAYEVAPGARRVIEMRDGLLGYANVFVHPDLRDVEVAFFPAYVRANQARHRRVWSLLRERAGEHTEASIAAILADRHDPDLGRAVELGNTIATPYTVASVVFRPADRRFWVGSGPVPASAGPFVGFDLRQRGPSGKPRTIEGPEPRSGAHLRAFARYVEAYRAFVERDDLAVARLHLDAALEIRPDAALYRFVAAILALRAGEPDAAERHCRAALAAGHLGEREARFHLALGWALDRQGRRDDARAEYAAALARAGDEPARRAARRGLRQRFGRAGARALAPEFFYGDVLL